ncbi:MAG: efflux RND transporter periplasmic adaptor subunit [Acidobacteriota bacterium]
MHRSLRLSLLLVLFLPACLPSGGGGEDVEGQQAGRRVQVETVRSMDVHRAVEAVGTLAAWDAVTLSAEVAGKVVRILADLGDPVQQGQVLVELDREKLQYRLEEQRAAYEMAVARYGAAGPEGALPDIESIPEVQRAAAELAQAERSWKRARELFQQELLPQQQRDEVETRHQSAKANYEVALKNARNRRADIDVAAANMRLAERELHDAMIRAPFDGYIEKRLVSPGQYLRVQSEVMRLVRVNPLKALAEVPERMAPWLKAGQSVELHVDAYPDRAFSGTITRISPAVNPRTRAFPLEVRVPNDNDLLKPGTFARLQITTDKVESILTLPVYALQYRYGVNRVFIVEGEQLASHEVELGDRLGDRVEVTAGISPGDLVAISEVEQLSDGLRYAPMQAGQ